MDFKIEEIGEDKFYGYAEMAKERTCRSIFRQVPRCCICAR